MKKLSYGKNKKLKQKSSIDEIFSEGKSFYEYPLRIKYVEKDDTKIGVAVPKKLVPKAKDRNEIKRKMRESYRLMQNDLDKHIHAMILYTSKNKEQSVIIKKALCSLILKINEHKASS